MILSFLILQPIEKSLAPGIINASADLTLIGLKRGKVNFKLIDRIMEKVASDFDEE